MQDKVFGTVEKGPFECIRAARSSYKGHEYLELRVYYEDRDGEMKPTKRGVTFHPEALPELIAALQAMLADDAEQEAET